MTATRIPNLQTATTVADLLHALGDIPPERVRVVPPIGQATLEDLINANESGDGPVCEWVDDTLVEKAVGYFESWVGTIISHKFMDFLETNDLGMLLGEAGVLRILPKVGRAGDVTFVAWTSLPGGKPLPRENKVPEVVPDLVVEVLSASNTRREMERKRGEYFTAGVKHVWEIDPVSESARAYTGVESVRVISKGGTLAAEDVLPGFTLSLEQLFARANRARGGG
ncbi:MAG: Uma2 family endonuclease [Gemmataceae bacterium]|nr:Uma2 family endonuclease [Gemmataceae bacterium]